MAFKSRYTDGAKRRLCAKVDKLKRGGMTTRTATIKAGISESRYYEWRKRLSEPLLTAEERQRIESMISAEERNGDVIDVEMTDGHETFRREPNEERPAGEDRETVRDSYVKALEATNAEQHAGILGLQAERDRLQDFAVSAHARLGAWQTFLVMLLSGKMTRKDLIRVLMKGWYDNQREDLIGQVDVDMLMEYIMGETCDAH